jgi:hypothetical protein
MKKYSLLIFIAFLLSSCSIGLFELPTFKDLDSIVIWVYQNITYEDKAGQAQDPIVTLKRTTGNCTSRAILISYLAYTNLGIKVDIAQWKYHAIATYKNKLLECIQYSNGRLELENNTIDTYKTYAKEKGLPDPGEFNKIWSHDEIPLIILGGK